MGWLTGWKRRKSHIVNPATGAGSDYQVKINVFKGDPILNADIINRDSANPIYQAPNHFSTIYYESGTYYLYHWHDGDTDIYCDTSADGKTGWAAQGVVLARGTAGSYDDYGVFNAKVWKEGATYYMIYTGASQAGPWIVAACLATASSPLGPWTKDASNPVFAGGGVGAWDYQDVETWDILKVGSTYYMYYNTLQHIPRKVGIATSTDLVNWTPDANNPIFTSSDVTISYGHYIASVIVYENSYYLMLTRHIDGQTATFNLYKDSSPTFYVADRTFLGSSLGVGVAYWETTELDGSMFLTSDIQGTPIEVNNAWVIYYDGRDSSNNWSTGIFYKYIGDYGDIVSFTNCQDDFGDIRFTDDDGTTLLDYWMEELVNADYAVFWVEVADSLESSVQTIYAYCDIGGGSSTTSDGEATFPFFDDFLGFSLDTDKWNTSIPPNGTIVVSGGTCILTTSAPAASQDTLLYGKTTFGQGYSIRSKFKFSNIGANTWIHYGFWNSASDYIIKSHETSAYAWSWRNIKTGSSTRTDRSSHAPSINTFYVFEIMRNGNTNSIFNRNNWQNGTISSNLPTSNMEAFFDSASANGVTEVLTVDWILIRKYINPEPMQGAWGPEEMQALKLSSSSATSLMRVLDMI